MGFTHDQLQDGRRLRVLTVVNQYTRKALANEACGSVSTHVVIDGLNRIRGRMGSRPRSGSPMLQAWGD